MQSIPFMRNGSFETSGMTEQNHHSAQPQLETTYSFFWYLLYVLSVIAADFINFCRFLLFPRSHLDFLFLVPLLFVLAYFIARKYFFFSKTVFSVWDAFCLALLTAFTLFKLPFPDFGFDTINYHITVQTSRFLNNLSESLFPATVASYMSPLGDGLFYGFRFILGYRAGTLLNLAVIIILYFQVRNLLVRSNTAAKATALVCALALLAVTTDFSLLNLSSYMIDLLGVPFVIAATCIAAGSAGYQRRHLKYIMLLSGICTAIKLTLFPFMAILLLVYLMRTIKQLRFMDVLAAGPYFLLPLCSYYLYAGINTGNPIFPYFNAIFKSPYARLDNFRDPRWGPKSFWEALIWPISGIFKPQRASELAFDSGRLGLGFALSMGALWSWRRQTKRLVNTRLAAAILLGGILSWSFLTGYMRYAIHLEVITGLFVALWVIELKSDRAGRMNQAFSIMLFLVLALQTCVGAVFIITKNLDWAWRPSLFTNWSLYVENLKLVGRDRESSRSPEYSHIETWVIYHANGGLASLAKPRVPILNMNLSFWEMDGIGRMREKLLQKLEGRTAYSVAFENDIKQILADLAADGFTLEEIFPLKNLALNYQQRAVIIRTRYKSGSAAKDEGANLLSDPSFERVLAADNPWAIPDPKNQVVMDGGSYDGRIFVKASVETPITQKVPILPDTVYHLSLFSRGDASCGACPIRLQMLWFKNDQVLSASLAVENSGLIWGKHDTYFVSPPSANAGAVFVNSHSGVPVGFDMVTLSAR